jgi:hypothetical protein
MGYSIARASSASQNIVPTGELVATSGTDCPQTEFPAGTMLGMLGPRALIQQK